MTNLENSAVFEALARKHIEALWRTALRMSGSRETADDLVQETCLRAFRSFSEYESGTNFKAWIFRILTNLCKDYYRRESRTPLKEWDDVEVKKATAQSNHGISQPDAVLEATDLTKDTYTAMSALKPNIRVVVSLSLLGDFSYQQISELLDIPVGTVRSRLNRGRMQLQADLFKYIDDDPLSGKESSNHGKAKVKKTNVIPVFPETANLKN